MTEDRVCVRTIRQARWHDIPDWLPGDEAPADCLPDLKTDDNTLSIYLLPSVGAEDLAEKVAVAIAAKRDSLDHCDYALFSAAALSEIAVEVNPIQGETGDRSVNDLHVDLVKLTATQVGRLAGAIRRTGRLRRLSKSKVKDRLAEALRRAAFDRSRVSAGVLNALKKGG